MSGAVVAVVVARARQRIVDHFVTAGATDPAHPVPFEPGPRWVDKRMFRRLAAFGALVEAQPGQYWLDQRRLADFRKESVAKVLGALAIAGLAAAGAIALGG